MNTYTDADGNPFEPVIELPRTTVEDEHLLDDRAFRDSTGQRITAIAEADATPEHERGGAPAATLALFAAAAGVPLPMLRQSTRYAPRHADACPRCDGERIARRTADGKPTAPHRCPVCRKRSKKIA